MSWDADLLTDHEAQDLVERSFNYTHNTNVMAATVLAAFGIDMPHSWFDGDTPKSWWKLLDGQTAEQSIAFLDRLIGGLMEAPTMFREMNPSNGWGNYDDFLAILVEMRDAARATPLGRWAVCG